MSDAASPRVGPVKKALSVAVQYSCLKQADPMLELEGTHNDTLTVRSLLVDVYGYKEDDVLIIMDNESDHDHWPTRENILAAMRGLVTGAQPGDHFVFHFSGHGSQVRNLDGTEKDGYDEVIWPINIVLNGDDEPGNYIKDDEIHDILVNHVPAGAHFMMIFDCCHSGSAADLPYSNEEYIPPTPSTVSTLSAASVKNVRIRGSEDVVSGDEQRRTRKETYTPVSQLPSDNPPPYADVTSWAACEDDQLALGNYNGGLFVTAFANALRKNPIVTHKELLQYLTRELATITATVNAHRPADSEAFDVPKPELESLQPMDKVYEVSLEI
ncbi:hypothetical protein AcV7_002629 [Taiwanofungus camphoratus]|nr:hypothetical protein AcV7_002629 [Antrodia cinnamomea]